MPTAPSRGLYAEVDNGAVHSPAIRGDAQRNPAANDLPSLALPVPRNDKYEHAQFEDAAFRVWFDGSREPVDTLEEVTVTPDGHRLVGRGGTELLTRVQAEFDQKAIHTAADDLITNNTNYATDVDAPVTSTETNTTLDTFTSNADWLAAAPIADIHPVTVSGGTINLSKTCFTQATNGDDTANSGVTQTLSGLTNYAGDDRFTFGSVGDFVEWEFTTDYTIPGDDFEFASRGEASGGSPPEMTWKLDINSTGSFVNLEFAQGNLGGAGLAWRGSGDRNANNVATPPDIPPGTHTVRLEATASGSDSWHNDAVAPRDTGDRYGGFGYDDDNTTNGDDELSGPEFRPDEFRVTFDLIPSPKAVTGIRAEATLDEGASDYTHYVSNDQGANFTSGTGSNLETDSLGTSFGPGVTYEAGLSRTGTGATGTPTEGRNGTDLQALTIKADLDTTPIVVNQSYDDHLLTILQDLADQGDYVFGVTVDDSGSFTVEWTSPGQRTNAKTASVAEFESTRKTGDDQQFDKVAVFGSAQSVNGVTFESNHGVAVSLAKDRLHELKERVYDSDTGEVFVRGVDYTMDYSAGTITTQASGDMDNSTQYSIDYTWQTFGEFDNGGGGAEGPPQEIPGLTSDRQCQQAARIIVDEVEHPVHEFRVVVPSDEAGWSVVEAFDFADVPTFGQRVEVENVENAAARTVLVGRNRKSIQESVGDIRQRAAAVSRKA